MGGKEGRREKKRCWMGGRDGQSNQRQNCESSLCTIKRGRCHIFGKAKTPKGDVLLLCKCLWFWHAL